MLANVLPGLREIRAPIVSGYVWLVFFFLALHGELPTRADAGSLLEPLFDLGDRMSVLGLATVASVAAYLVGSAMQELLKLLGRRASPDRPFYADAGVHLSWAGAESLRRTLLVRGEAITRKLAQQALSPGERGIDRIPEEVQLERELPLVRTLLLGEQPELIAELDRLQAEADLRVTVAFPIAFLALLLGVKASPGWLIFLLPAALLFVQGLQRQRDAGDFLARILQIGRADAPALASFELSVDAALDRIEVEWRLRREMEEDSDGRAAFRLGNLQASAGEYQLAAASLRTAADSDLVQAYAELGRAYERLDEFDNAERAYRDGDERGDSKAAAYLALFLSRRGRSEEAREAAKRAGGDRPEAEQGDAPSPWQEDPAEMYQRAVDEGDAKAAINLGLLYKRRGDAERAIGAMRKATELDPRDPAAWRQLGIALSEVAASEGMAEAFERAQSLQEASLSPDHLDVAGTIEAFANALDRQGRGADSIPLFRRALEIKEARLGPDHMEVARVLANLGNPMRGLGEYGEAAAVLERALTIAEAEYGPDHLQVAWIKGGYASVIERLGEYARARALQESTLAIKEKDLPSGDVSISLTLGNLSNQLSHLGEYEEALERGWQALEIKENELREDDFVLARGRVNVGNALRGTGKPDPALPLQRLAVPVFRSRLPATHPEVIEAEGDLAETLREIGRAEEAVQTQLHNLELETARLGESHVDVAFIRRALGHTLNRLGRFEEAREQLSAALGFFEQSFAPDHVEVGRTIGLLAATEAGLGAFGRATEMFDRALTIARRTLPEGGVELAELLTSAALAQLRAGDGDAAAAMLRRAGEITAAADSARARARVSMAEAELAAELSKVDEAISLVDRAIALLEDDLDGDHIALAEPLERAAHLREEGGRTVEAAALRERARSIRDTTIE